MAESGENFLKYNSVYYCEVSIKGIDMNNYKTKIALSVIVVIACTLTGCKRDKPSNAPKVEQKTVQTQVQKQPNQTVDNIQQQPKQPIENTEDIEKAFKEAGIEITEDMQKEFDKKKAEGPGKK